MSSRIKIQLQPFHTQSKNEVIYTWKFVNLYYIIFLKIQYWYLQHLLPRACLVIAWKVSKYGPEKTPYMDNFLIVFLIEIKLLTRLNLGLSYFRQNNFKKDIVNPLCCCSLEVEPTSNFSLQCQTWNTFVNVPSMKSLKLIHVFWHLIKNLPQNCFYIERVNKII